MRGVTLVTCLVLVFSIGFIANMLVADASIVEFPFGSASERASPSDWIKEDQILLLDDGVHISGLNHPIWARFENSNSMDPLLDETANAIEVVPASEDDIHVGDIVAYDAGGYSVIHRVIEKSEDAEGVFFILKGDNNAVADPGKVRFKDIKRVLVAILY